MKLKTAELSGVDLFILNKNGDISMSSRFIARALYGKVVAKGAIIGDVPDYGPCC